MAPEEQVYGVGIYRAPHGTYSAFWAPVVAQGRTKNFAETLVDLVANGNTLISQTRSGNYLPQREAQIALSMSKDMVTLLNSPHHDSFIPAARKLFKKEVKPKGKQTK